MAEILRSAGVTDELLAERISQGLNATIVSKSTTHARREVLVDYEERREMVELVCKLKGHLLQKHEISGPDGGFILHLKDFPPGSFGREQVELAIERFRRVCAAQGPGCPLRTFCRTRRVP